MDLEPKLDELKILVPGRTFIQQTPIYAKALNVIFLRQKIIEEAEHIVVGSDGTPNSFGDHLTGVMINCDSEKYAVGIMPSGQTAQAQSDAMNTIFSELSSEEAMESLKQKVIGTSSDTASSQMKTNAIFMKNLSGKTPLMLSDQTGKEISISKIVQNSGTSTIAESLQVLKTNLENVVDLEADDV
jgi:hypothetical protein